MRRPSPALVVAFLALLGAWGGPAVAKKLITSSDIKDRSIQGRDIRSNTVTGRIVKNLSARDLLPDSLDGSVIDESQLGQVPSAAQAGHAASADSATHAATADGVQGMHVARIAYARLVNTDNTPVYDEGGLRLQARCSGSGALDVDAVASASDNDVVHVSATAQGSGSTSTQTAVSSDNDLRPGQIVDALPAGAQGATGTISFWNPTGDTVTVTYLAQENLGAARGYQCLFSGTAVHTAP